MKHSVHCQVIYVCVISNMYGHELPICISAFARVREIRIFIAIFKVQMFSYSGTAIAHTCLRL